MGKGEREEWQKIICWMDEFGVDAVSVKLGLNYN